MSQHLDGLTDADIRFLDQEARSGHGHIGWVVVLAGPPPSLAELLAHVEARLHLVPRHRQKLAWPPVPLARPLWVDDPHFSLEYHVHHTALPAPGSEEQLRALASHVYSQGLDRSKPLWELWLVQGLEGGRFALVHKAHHALADGVSGVPISTVLLDAERVPEPPEPPAQRWQPAPEPGAVELLAAAARDAVAAPLRSARGALQAVIDPAWIAGTARGLAQEARSLAMSYLHPPSPTPLNVPIGTRRQVVWLRRPLDEFKAIKNALGSTVNDAYIAVVAGALRRWLVGRGIRPEGLRLRAAVPVSLRSDDADWRRTQRVVEWFAPLPVDCWDPVERLRRVHRALGELKKARLAVDARTMAELRDFAPSGLLAQASRLPFSLRRFNLVVTNLPGPQSPLYALGREVLRIAPVTSLVEGCALGVVMVSYHGSIEIGLTGDADALPDLDAVAAGLEASIDELGAAAARHAAGRLRRKAAPRARRAAPERSA